MCHDGNGKYLLGLRGDKSRDEVSTWSPLGTGGVEHGDTVEETVDKEVKEEVGVTPISTEFIGWYQTFRSEGQSVNHWVQFVYKVQVDSDQVRIDEPEKCSELGCFH